MFFTARPAGGQRTIYARVPKTGNAQERETLEVSAPQCNHECAHEEAQPATFQGASADGSKVFFTTAQELLPSDKDETTDLYEYDVPERKLVLLSEGDAGDATPGNGAEVQGVVRSASDGSRVYFVAKGKLTNAENSFHQSAQAGQNNLYVVNTVLPHVGELGFVATLGEKNEKSLWGAECVNEGEGSQGAACDERTRHAQTTPDGDYLVFDTAAHLTAADHNGCPESLATPCTAEALYRYNALTGELTWISRPAPGFAATNENDSALVEGIWGAHGAIADIADVTRAITDNGQEVVFSTTEKLQADDVNHANDAYLWSCDASCEENHEEGTVSMVSDGHDPQGVGAAAISSSGADVLFSTRTELVPQDTDTLVDLYDARVDGGIEAEAGPSCAGEACQGKPGAAVEFAPPASELFSAGANLAAPVADAKAAPAKGKVKPAKRHKAKKRRRPAAKRSLRRG